MYSVSMTTDDHARMLFRYMRLGMPLTPADAVLGLGSSEKRVADRASQLFLAHYGGLLIFSGGYGKITQHSNGMPEAEQFRDIAISKGVPGDKILIESKSTNTGDNIRFTEQLIKSRDIKLKSLIIVTKPYMERRAFAAFKKQWSDHRTQLVVTSPNLEYEDMFDDENSKDHFISIMVGDLQRIKVFPSLGFQIEQAIPEEVWRSFITLVQQGFTDYLIQD